LGNFLGNQRKLRRVCFVALIMEGHRFERQKSVTCFVHRLYLGLKSTRRADRAQLTGGVDQDRNRVGVVGCDSANMIYKTTVGHVRTGAADTNNIACGRDTGAGTRAKSGVPATCTSEKCALTNGRVTTGSRVVKERFDADRRVVVSTHFSKQRVKP